MDEPRRWARFQSAGGPQCGYVVDEHIQPVTGSMFGEWRDEGGTVPLAGTKLLAPVIPPTFYACGINYAGHCRTASDEFGLDYEGLWPKAPEIGYRAQSAIIGPGATIVLPADVPDNVQAESELAVVIGTHCRHATPANALDCVFGYTIANDVSARGWQFGDRTFWRSKNSDTFKPLGPWIATGVALEDMQTTVSVNGAVYEQFRTADMIYSVADYIVAITRYITLVPGDVIIMGTDGRCPPLLPGDLVEIAIEPIGVLANPVAKETR